MKIKLSIKKDKFPLLLAAGLTAVIILLAITQLRASPANSTHQVSIINSEGKAVIFNVEIADNDADRIRGLSGRTSLAQDSGVFFVFDNENQLGFWMKGMYFPIDMIFFDKNLKVIEMNQNVLPCNTGKCPVYMTQNPGKYVLEINAGLARQYNITAGNAARYV